MVMVEVGVRVRLRVRVNQKFIKHTPCKHLEYGCGSFRSAEILLFEKEMSLTTIDHKIFINLPIELLPKSGLSIRQEINHFLPVLHNPDCPTPNWPPKAEVPRMHLWQTVQGGAGSEHPPLFLQAEPDQPHIQTAS